MQRQNLILVHPPQAGLLEGFSAGLISLANYITQTVPAVEVTLLDLGLTPLNRLLEEVRNALRGQSEPLWVGISTTTATYQSALAVARAVRQLNPGARIVFGGHHAAPQDDVVLRRHRHLIDVVVRGEGEIALAQLLQHPCDWARVPGITYWGDDDRLIRTQLPVPLSPEELDRLPVTFRGNGIRSAPGKFDHVTYVSARGCPLGCHFCAVANQSIRAKSVGVVLRDLHDLVRGHGFRSIAIEDNFFAQNRRRTLELCEAIERSGLKFGWDCQTRVESCSPDVIHALRRANCEAVYLGVESLNPNQLLYLGKTRAPERYLEQLRSAVVPNLLRAGVDCYINIQLGIPGELPHEREQMLAQLAYLGRIANAAGRSITIFPQLHVVYPGTHHFATAVAEHRFGAHSSEIFEPFTEWEAEQEPVLTWLGYHFAHGTGGIPEGILRDSHLLRGSFEVEANAVCNVTTALSAMDEIEGIRVFRYTAFLAEEASESVRLTSLAS